MYIGDHVLDFLISQLVIEYYGTHNSDQKNPLWGRHAYWRVYLKDGTYIAKVTVPVKCIKPGAALQARLLKAELRKRLEAIGEVCEYDHYGMVQIGTSDPYGIRSILSAIEGKYWQFEKKAE